MLRELRVANLVLIREASLALAPGLNVLTGETGAGKTIVAQAVSAMATGIAAAKDRARPANAAKQRERPSPASPR